LKSFEAKSRQAGAEGSSSNNARAFWRWNLWLAVGRTYSGSIVVLGLLILASATFASAQVTAGEASMNLSGSFSSGYSGSFGNLGSSSHGIGFGGVGDLSGFYHSPQFLSFDVAPFYDQSRTNSSYQSITDSSGVTASTSIFGGSKYPGSLTYSNIYNSEGNFLLPGVANYKTNGNSQTLGVGWSANPTDTLSFSAGYQDAGNNSSVYGTSNQIESDFQSIFAASHYRVAGFRLGGGVHYSNGSFSFPQIITGQTGQTSHVDTTTYNFDLSRSVAWQGNTWLNYSRNTTAYDALGVKSSETDNVLTGGVSLKPTKKLNVSFGADYDDNLAATLYRVENNTGAVILSTFPAEQSTSWGVYGNAQYDVVDQLYVTGNFVHRQQHFLGSSFDSTAYSGGVNYGRQLLGGRFTGSMIVTRTGLGSNGGSLVGLLSNAIYTRRIGVWNVNGSFTYSRSIQTLLIAYTTSGYGYSTSVGRRFGKLYWTGSASGSKSMVSQELGANSFTQGYSTAFSYRWLGVSGAYSRSRGLGLFTSQGIAQLPPGLPPSLVLSTILYGGTTYSAGLGATPIRGLTFSGSYESTRSNTENGPLSSNNHTEEAYSYLQYKFRKVFLTAGYSRLIQGFSASTLEPAMVSTYYVGLSRWFNFF
jgi:hypothetical protein